jgi:ClpP class serine protease
MLRALDLDDAEDVLRAIRQTDPETPIDLVVHTPGGIMLAGEQIARALRSHQSEVTIFVPHHALSGGTLIALAAERIVMDPNAVLGPVDPQIQSLPAASILDAVSRKDINEVDDETLILANVGRKALNQMRESVMMLVNERLEPEQAEKLAHALTSGQWTHDFPITVERAQKLNLPVDTEMPESIYELMNLFPRRAQQYPSVQYVPDSERNEEDKSRGSTSDRMVTY